LKEKQAVSYRLAGLILILIVAAIVLSLVFSMIVRVPGISVNLDVKIYDSKQNIGVLNEDAFFNVTFRNHGNFNQSMRIAITAGNVLLKNLTVTLEPETSKNVTFTQKLDSLGEWKVEVLDKDNETVTSYSFLVVLNEGEANFRINQWNNAQYSKNLATISTVVAVTSLTISAINVHKKSRVKKLNKEACTKFIKFKL